MLLRRRFLRRFLRRFQKISKDFKKFQKISQKISQKTPDKTYRVNVKNPSLALRVGKRQFDLSVNTARPQKRRIQGFNTIGRHNHLHIPAVIEAIQLIQQLQHGSLNFSGTRAGGVVTFGANGINFIDEDNGRGHVSGRAENITNKLGTLARVLLNQFRAHQTQEGGRGLVGNSLG